MAENTNEPGPRWIKTTQNRIGVVLMMAGVVAAALFITALAGGFEGWVWIAAAATVLLIGAGFLSLRAGARRSVEPRPIVYHPDSPDVALDVDPDSGKRTPHQD